jgi:hypothetical protein
MLHYVMDIAVGRITNVIALLAGVMSPFLYTFIHRGQLTSVFKWCYYLAEASRAVEKRMRNKRRGEKRSG